MSTLFVAIFAACLAVVAAAAAAAAVRRRKRLRRTPRTNNVNASRGHAIGAQGGYDVMTTATEHLPHGTESTAAMLPEFVPQREIDARHDGVFDGWKPSWVDSTHPRFDAECVDACEADGGNAPTLRCRHDCAYY